MRSTRALGLARIAREEVVDDRSGPGLGAQQLDPHRAPGVISASDDSGLLEHPHEYAWIVVARRDLHRVDRAAELADGTVDAAKIVGPGNVAHGKPPDGVRVGRAGEQQRCARRPVPAAAPHHLHVALERVRVVEQANEADVGLVDPHAECRRRHDAADPAVDEIVLHARTLFGLQTCVVVLHAKPVPAQRSRNALAGVARAGIHDGAAVPHRAQPLHEDAQAILVAGDLLDVVAEVRSDDAGSDDREIAAECRCDLGGRRGCSRRRHPEHRRIAECFERSADEQVVGPEVVPPHAHAMHLVDDDEADADRAEHVDERGVPEPLGRSVEKAGPTCRHVLDPARRHLAIERRVDERRRGRDLGRQLVDLVLHERDQGREDECRLGPQHGRKLVGE